MTSAAKASACPSTMAAIAHTSGSPPWITASAPRTYMTGFRKNVKLIAKRSRQPTVRSSGRNRLDAVSLDLRHDAAARASAR